MEKDTINSVIEKIVQGYSAGEIRTQFSITRSEWVLMLNSNTFKDEFQSRRKGKQQIIKELEFDIWNKAEALHNQNTPEERKGKLRAQIDVLRERYTSILL
jgi:hypothetical protein